MVSSFAAEKRHLDDHEVSDDDLGKVYHDMACECHYTFGEPLKCCHDDKPPHKGPVQVSFDGLNVKGDGRSEEDKQYRRNFCNGIMYLLESEGIDLETANDAILEGLNLDIVDFDIIDGESSATVAATITTAWFEDEDASVTETLSTVPTNNNEPEDADADKTVAETITSATDAVLSTTEANDSTTGTAKQIDASTLSIMTASTTEDSETNDNSSVATGVTIGVLFALIALILGIAMTITRRKREEKKRLAEFAGEELIDDDVEANSVHNDVVAIDTMDCKTIEITKEGEMDVAGTEVATADENNDDNSDAMSVVSLNQDECAQISFQEDQDGGVEAKVSTLAAMGVASTVTSRLSTQQAGETDV